MVILDTNVISALERHGPDGRRLMDRLSDVPDSDVFVTVISYEEQLRGWMSAIAGAKTGVAQVEQYDRLLSQLHNYCNLQILRYSEEAAAQFDLLRKQHRHTGSPDLKIASIAIVNRAVLLTRNLRDFRNMPGLRVEDWT